MQRAGCPCLPRRRRAHRFGKLLQFSCSGPPARHASSSALRRVLSHAPRRAAGRRLETSGPRLPTHKTHTHTGPLHFLTFSTTILPPAQAAAFSLAIAGMNLVALTQPALSALTKADDDGAFEEGSQQEGRHAKLAKALQISYGRQDCTTFVTTVWVGHAAPGRPRSATKRMRTSV